MKRAYGRPPFLHLMQDVLLIPFFLLFLLTESSSVNSLLDDATTLGKATAEVANALQGHGGLGKGHSFVSGFEEKTGDIDDRGGREGTGRTGGRGRAAEVNVSATQPLSLELVKEEHETMTDKREPALMKIKLGEEKRIRRSKDKIVGHEHDKTDDHHEKDTSDKEHHDVHSHSWKYYGVYGPSNWSLVAPDCSSDRPRQTPIDIQTTLTALDETLLDINLIVTDPPQDQSVTMKVTMVNNGHTVNVVFDNTIRVDGGKLGNVFRVAGVHFHWGASDYTGSEHTINGERFPLEMHIVSYDEERFSGLAETLSSNNSLAVLGVLFTISSDYNPAIEPIVSNLMSVQKPGTSTSIPYFDLRTLLPPKHTTHFYRYFGSLTTPPCSEVVIWTVFKHPQTISHAQLARFRELYEAKTDNGAAVYLRHNWRPLQPIQGRIVARSFPDNVPLRRPPPAPQPTPPRRPPPPSDQVAVAAVNGGCNCQSQSSGHRLTQSYYPSTMIGLMMSFLFILSAP